MLLEPPPVKRGKISEAQRFARKLGRQKTLCGLPQLLFGSLATPAVGEMDLGDLCIEGDRALVERAEKEGRL